MSVSILHTTRLTLRPFTPNDAPFVLVLSVAEGLARKVGSAAQAVTATMLVYHFGIRRFAIGRFITGMKPRPSGAHPARLAPPTGAAVGPVLDHR